MRFPSRRYDTASTRDWYEKMSTDIVVLEIAFTSMQYASIIQAFSRPDLQVELREQEHSMTFWSFLDNVGGVAGLWLGASLITLLKFLTVTIPLIIHGSVKKRQAHSGNDAIFQPYSEISKKEAEIDTSNSKKLNDERRIDQNV